MSVNAPSSDERHSKPIATDILGERKANILLLISRYGTWEKVKQYEPGSDTLSYLQSMIDDGYVDCDQSGEKLWITEKARNEFVI